MQSETQAVRVPRQELQRFTEAVLRAAGAGGEQVAQAAEVMVWCDAAERATQGILRLPVHVRRLKAGVVRCSSAPAFERVAPGLGRLDADGAFGQVGARLGMEHALALASEAGVGVVGVRRSNNCGALSYFVAQAAARGMVGLCVSNSFPKVAAHGGVHPVVGTNPFAFSAPRPDGRHILVDTATSAAAGSTIRVAQDRGERLPEGMAVDPQGHPITDPAQVKNGALLPLAGARGFGLSLMVEVLSGVLSGAGIGPEVRSMFGDFTGNGDNGQLLLALDVTRLLSPEAYAARMDQLAALILGSALSPGDVRLPGEARWQALQRSEEQGVPLAPAMAQNLAELAAELNVKTPW